MEVIHHWHLITQIPINMIIIPFYFPLITRKNTQKNNFKKNEFIWCYKNYGPCFYYDLQFVEKTMNKVKFDNHNYLTPKDFINNDEAIKYGDSIFLEIFEVYQILIYDEK